LYGLRVATLSVSIKIRIFKFILFPGDTVTAIYLKLYTDCFAWHITGLYVLLDWAKDDYVFVDTGVGCVSVIVLQVSLAPYLVWCTYWIDTIQLIPCSATPLPFIGIWPLQQHAYLDIFTC